MPASYFSCTRSSQLFRIVFCCLALTAVVGLSGCSRSKNGQVATYRVKGKILLDGQPAEGANVAFFIPGVKPKEPPLPEAAAKMMRSGKVAETKESEVAHPFPTAIVDSAGNFELTTYRPKDGCPLGNFVVVLSRRKSLNPNASDPDYGPEEFPDSYTKPETSPLKVEIKGGTTLDTFEIKSPPPRNS